ncbi:MAG: CopG family transcriptional regulator [Tsuneonella suprasediminis]
MLNRDKVRYQLFLEPRLAERLEEMAAKPGIARSDILVAALDAWLTRQGSNDLDERFGPRLDRMSLQIGRLGRDMQVLLESLSLFVHQQFCLNAQIPEVASPGGRSPHRRISTRMRSDAFSPGLGQPHCQRR